MDQSYQKLGQIKLCKMSFARNKIIVLGMGLVGQTTSVFFAEKGNEVVGVDCDSNLIANLKKGQTSIFEPELASSVSRYLERERLEFSDNMRESLLDADIIIFTMGSPLVDECDLNVESLFSSAEQIAEAAMSNKVIVCKSTVPLGTCQRLQSLVDGILSRRQVPFSVEIISNPEFLRSGQALYDVFNQSRIVIGSRKNSWAVEKYLTSYNSRDLNLVLTTWENAELSKVVCNAFMATRISFINEVSRICESTGADIRVIRDVLQKDPRFGEGGLEAGLGFGGSCLPKDLSYFIGLGKSHEIPMPLARATLSVNTQQISHFYSKIESYFGGILQDKKITVWGLSFKPMTSDLRESKSLTLINFLLQKGAKVQIYDPVVSSPSITVPFLDKVEFFDSAETSLSQAQALCVCTDWQEFSTFDFSGVRSQVSKEFAIFDGRGALVNNSSREMWPYYCVGVNLL